MIPDPIIQRLRENWGEKADSMDCYAEVKFIHETPPWECYIYALDPGNDDTIACIMPHGEYLLWEWSLKELSVAFNHLGEFPYRDPEYRRMKASEIYKKLRGTI